MKKILVMPDSFKGTMTSVEACDIMERAINEIFPQVEVRKIPVADGGEGSVDCFLQAMGGERRYKRVSDPYFQKIDAYYGMIDDKTAVVEMAVCAGLNLAEEKNPTKTTTYGVGELILDAIESGAKKIILALGGSSTNDCGAGMIAALGAKFFDKNNKEFVPVGGTLCDIAYMDTKILEQRLVGIEVVVMCDIDNPLYGEMGASKIYSRQKGADDDMIELLEQNVIAYANLCKKNYGVEPNFEGAGAAGGMGFAAKYFLGGQIAMGIEVILDTVDFGKLLESADLVISGEGKIDAQSLSGKVVIGIAKRTNEQNVPLVAVVGDIGQGAEGAYEKGVSAVFSINRVALPYLELRKRAKNDMYLTMCDIMRLIKISR